MNINIIFFTKFNCSRVHHTGSEARHLEHLIITDLVHFYSFFIYSRIACVNSVNISVNFTFLSSECRCQCDGGCIRAASTKCGNIIVFVDALESSYDNNFALIQLIVNSLCVNTSYACFCMDAIGCDIIKFIY